MKSRRFLILLLPLALFVAACSRSPDLATKTGKPLTRIILQTDWYAQAEHGGYYQALAKGYYRDAGLDVVISQAGPSMPIILKLATDKVQFMISRGDDVITHIARDIPIIIVEAQMQHDLQAVLVHKESPVYSFKDLDGRSVMTGPGSNWVSYLRTGLNIKVNIIPLDFGMARFMADPNYIQQCFLTNEPYFAELHGEPTRVLLFSDAGYDFYRVLAGNADWVKAHPEATRAFIKASDRGWKEYLTGDRSAADAMILHTNPQMKKEYIDYAVSAMRKYRLVEGDAEKGEALGLLDRRRLQHQINLLGMLGVLAHPVTVDDIADLRFGRSD